jgi:fumarylacetoacetate (FAA) hydrolase
VKLASLKNGTRDGTLVVVSTDLKTAVSTRSVAGTLQAALDDWSSTAGRLQELSDRLNAGELDGNGAFAFDETVAESPLPRAYQWLDGSTYLSHYNRIKGAMNFTDAHEPGTGVPLMYQGAGDDFQPPHGNLSLPDEAHDIDFELELAVITDAVPLGVSSVAAAGHVVLVALINDVSLRGLITAEMATGFGPITAKPSSALAPVVVTPDELGSAWSLDGIDLTANVRRNGEFVARPNARGMAYGFHELIARAATTRALGPGTVVGSGTVSDDGGESGYACIAERRAVEIAEHGVASTPFLKHGDRIELWMDKDGSSVFGSIDQTVVIG